MSIDIVAEQIGTVPGAGWRTRCELILLKRLQSEKWEKSPNDQDSKSVMRTRKRGIKREIINKIYYPGLWLHVF